MLNDELRFRQDLNLRYSVSQDCYLYHQRGITNEEHIQNLRLLTSYLPTASDQMLDQRPHLKTFVTFILMENRIQLQICQHKQPQMLSMRAFLTSFLMAHGSQVLGSILLQSFKKACVLQRLWKMAYGLLKIICKTSILILFWSIVVQLEKCMEPICSFNRTHTDLFLAKNAYLTRYDYTPGHFPILHETIKGHI